MASEPHMHPIDVERHTSASLPSMLILAGSLFAFGVLLFALLELPRQIGWALALVVPAVVAGSIALAAFASKKVGSQEATVSVGWEGDLVHYRKVDGSLHSIDLRRVRRVEFSEVEAGDVEFYVEGGDRISLYPGLGYSGKLGMSLLEAIKAWCSKTGRPCHLERRQISRFPRVVFYSLVIGESEEA